MNMPEWLPLLNSAIVLAVGLLSLGGLLRKVVRSVVENIVAQRLDRIQIHLDKQDAGIQSIDARLEKSITRLHSRVDEVNTELKKVIRNG